MAITDDLRKTFSDPTPLYFAAGTADLALQQAKKVPALVDQLRADAPARIDAVRNTDPKAVQARATARAKEAGVRVRETQENLQTRVNGFLNYLDTDLKKLSTNLDADLKRLGESAQDLALRGVGVAAEYAVKARETYEKVAEHGEQAVRTWRGQAADGIEDIAEEVEELAVAVEPQSEPKAEPVVVKEDGPAENGATPITARKNQAKGKGPNVRKAPPTAKKPTPPTP
ncbi:hypothetical protein ABZ723_11005 [Streptomyces sp. NPDC006700]|uniref:hypothetical protein n=1 Tax=unclassified Streptomyces TaxID=2593676 RepID=UPI0033DF65D0